MYEELSPAASTTPVEHEVTYIVHPRFTAEALTTEMTAVEDDLRASGAAVKAKREELGLRRMAYEIDDVREGYYVVVQFTATTAQTKAFEKTLRLRKSVMRALVIRLEE